MKSKIEVTQQTIKFLEAILGASVDGILISDINQNIILVNKAFCNFLCARRQDVIETNIFFWLEQFDNNAVNRWSELEASVHSKESVQNIIFQKTTRDVERYFSVNASILQIVINGQKGVIVSIWRDITKQMQAKQKLRESEERLTSFMETATDGFLIFDKELNLLEINNPGLKILGMSKENMIDKNILEISLGLEKTGRYDKYLKVLKTGEPLHIDDLIPHPKFGDIYISVSVFKVGEGLGIIFSDITKRKQAENKLKEFSEQLEDMVDERTKELQKSKISLDNAQRIAHIGNWDWDIVKNELYWSDEIYRIFSLNSLEFGATYEAFVNTIHPDDRELVQISVDEALCDNKPYSIDHRIILPNGSIRIVHEQAEVNFDETGKALKMFGTVQDITDYKKAEQKLKESEEKYKSLFEQTPIAILLINFELRIEDCNTSAEVLFGYTREELLGIDSLKLDNIPPDTKFILAKSFSKYIKTGVPEHSEIQMYKKDGKMIWINSYPIQVKIAEKSYILVMIQDITERKKKEEEIRLQIEIIENMSEGVYLIKLDDGTIVYTNPAFEEMFGYNPGEMIGKDIAIVNAPTDKTPEEIKNEIVGILKNTGEWHGEVLNIKKDGTPFWCYANVSLFDHPEHGRVIVSVHTDITERKKAEMELQLERDNLFNVLSSMEDGVYIVDQNYDIEYVNPSLTKEFGQYEGKKCYKYLHSRQDVCPWCKYPEVFEGKTVRWEWYSFKNQKTYDLINTPLKNVDGSVSKLEIFRDITEFKKAEAELRKTMENLKRSNAELEQFAHVASHDLQEPLRMVASFTQLLQNRYQDKLDDDANDFINFAVDGANRMQNLISDLLIFSRVGTRGKPFKTTDLNIVIEAVINLFRQIIKETDTKITYKPLPVILADESQMIQLLQNLISNAIKFRSEEPPHIHISGEVKADKWIFSVSDNGIGMDSKYFDRIFIIFQRLHKKSEYRGTGIGLAVCKKIIERHKGKIWVESEVGKGSTFYFSIPKTEVRN